MCLFLECREHYDQFYVDSAHPVLPGERLVGKMRGRERERGRVGEGERGKREGEGERGRERGEGGRRRERGRGKEKDREEIGREGLRVGGPVGERKGVRRRAKRRGGVST